MRSNSIFWVACAAACGAIGAASHAQTTQKETDIVASKAGAKDLRRSDASLRASRPELPETARRIVASTNAFRRQENLPAIKSDVHLLSAARYFANFMARTDKYGHTADGNEPATRAKNFGYEYCIVAENIAYQFNSAGFATGELATRFVEGWKNSPGHRRNMLDPNVTDTAVAIARSGATDHYYAVQLFGRPKSEAVEFSVANRAHAAVEYSVDDQTFPLPPRATRTHQLCKRVELGFRGKTLRPDNGQRLVVVNEEGGAQIKVQ